MYEERREYKSLCRYDGDVPENYDLFENVLLTLSIVPKINHFTTFNDTLTHFEEI